MTPAFALAGLVAVSGCERLDEDALRAALGQWFALGETVQFTARVGCVSGAFRLVDAQIGSSMPVLSDEAGAARAIAVRGRMALDDPSVAPDRALVDLANRDRALGMTLRRAALEGRDCMDPGTEAAFHDALTRPEAVLAHDAGLSALILLDPVARLLLVVIGGQG